MLKRCLFGAAVLLAIAVLGMPVLAHGHTGKVCYDHQYTDDNGETWLVYVISDEEGISQLKVFAWNSYEMRWDSSFAKWYNNLVIKEVSCTDCRCREIHINLTLLADTHLKVEIWDNQQPKPHQDSSWKLPKMDDPSDAPPPPKEI